MGVLFLVLPIDSEDAREWLREHGIPVPSETSRPPTFEDLLAVGKDLEARGFEVTKGESGNEHDWAFTGPSGEQTTIWITTAGDAADFHWQFHKGAWEVNLLITKLLARRCGPLIATDDVDVTPWLVTEDTDTDALLKAWIGKDKDEAGLERE